MRTTTIPALALLLALGLAACGGSDDSGRQAFIDGVIASSGGEADEETAGCMYDVLAEDLDSDQLAALAEDFAAEPSDPAVAGAVISAVEDCFEGG